MTSQPTHNPLSVMYRLVLALMFAVVPLFGSLVVWRSCFMQKRHTDFGVYARAGWAVRSGNDIYEVVDQGGLHYCYPPPFAFFMAPFAEPPGQVSSGWYAPFVISVAIWYCLSVAFAFYSVHVLASELEKSGVPPKDRRQWWSLRIWPVLLTLPALGNSLSHGQANTLLLLTITLAIAGMMAGRSVAAGAWMAGAVALKVIPAFLLLVPLLRRNKRFAVGVACGLFILLVGLPALCWGPTKMMQTNAKFFQVMIFPAVGDASDSARSKEMFQILKTDNQSIQAMLHAWQHWRDPNAPAQPSGSTRAAHWFLGAVMTTLTVWAGRRHRTGNDLLLLMGSLTVVMLLVSPMCHLHYYVLAMPLVTGLVFASRRQMEPSRRLLLACCLGLHVVGGAIPLLVEPYRNLGFAPLSTLPLWCLAIRELRRPSAPAAIPVLPVRKAA